MKYKYYILYPRTMGILGPLSYKEAVREFDSSAIPCQILKVVLDENGREVN